MSKKILITGATGLIGKSVFGKLISRGYKIQVLTRNVGKARLKIPGAEEYVYWKYPYDSAENWSEGADAVIHLAGENIVSGRWSEKQKEKIMRSRIESTKYIVDLISRASIKPGVLICASATGYYGNTKLPVDENSAPGGDFLAELVKKWEEEAATVEKFGVRRVSVRTGIVLDKNDGALVKMIIPFRYFVGGPLGDGMQWMPWIHINDLADLFLFALENADINGAVNATAPNPVTMNEFAKTLSRVLNRPSFFRVPGLLLKIIMGEASGIILNGANVLPRKAMEAGFKFRYEHLAEALKNILGK